MAADTDGRVDLVAEEEEEQEGESNLLRRLTLVPEGVGPALWDEEELL